MLLVAKVRENKRCAMTLDQEALLGLIGLMCRVRQYRQSLTLITLRINSAF